MFRQFLSLRLWPLAGLSVLFTLTLGAQTALAPRESALRFLQTDPASLGLTPADVADLRVNQEYRTAHNGVTHVWLQQQYNGIPVHDALFGVHVKAEGSIVHVGHRFVAGLAGRVNTNLPSIGAAQALEMVKLHLGFQGGALPGVREKINEQNWIFEGGDLSRDPIPVTACYEVMPDGPVRLAWMLVVHQATTSDVWSIRVDAQTGAVLSKYNRTVNCRAGESQAGSEARVDKTENSTTATAPAPFTGMLADESYRVFPWPIESPAHGNRELVLNPADPAASPFGWLDVNGLPGADYAYTRGNNVWAYDDQANDDVPGEAESAPATGPSVFDYPFDPAAEPGPNRLAGITNLFYLANKMHDFTYRFGFDEAAGNFQVNNYGNTGFGDDPVLAESLDGEDEDNADFSWEPDGFSSRMQMFRWSRRGGNLVQVNAPGSILGTYFASQANGWGGVVTATPVTGDVEVADDGTATPTLACELLSNNLTGKIAMVDRGTCDYSLKALNAQNAGALACIVCNFLDGTSSMGPGDYGGQVTIPVVMMKKGDCDLLRQYAGNGLNVSLVLPQASGPEYLDAAFDNSIVSHEYGHGVSYRLTGGSGPDDCLSNAEQNHGEGWSDFFALATGVRAGDTPATLRGIGSYIYRQPNDGQGVRRYPYSNDLTINPLTFASVAENFERHAVGEVWSAVLWDLYWAMVAQYGYDADINNTASGNFRAVQLVMDGLKLQPCRPGFVDGRNAIMTADILNYGGVDTCLISMVFARRGLGYLASQGSNEIATDGTENFDPIPVCLKELKITKATSTPLIEAGGQVEFTITVTNHKDEAVTNVSVADELPVGLSLLGASNGGTFSSGHVTWSLGTLASGQVMTLTYTAASAAGTGSIRLFNDPMETNTDWTPQELDQGSPIDGFMLQNTTVQVGQYAWQAPNRPYSSDKALQSSQNVAVPVGRPVLRFWHQYETEPGTDAGLVEITLAEQYDWEPVSSDRVFRELYDGRVPYSTFFRPFLSGFSGQSNGWVRSYIDLSDYAGQEINVRFRFGSNGLTAPGNGRWVVDELEVLDMLNYDGEVCVNSAQGDVACGRAPEGGVIVNPAVVGTTEPDTKHRLSVAIQPNPASGRLYLTSSRTLDGPVQIELHEVGGREVSRLVLNGLQAGQALPVDLFSIPSGSYFLRLRSAQVSIVEKVIVY